MKLLIDGDVVAYRAAFASEKTKYLVTLAGATPYKELVSGVAHIRVFDDAKSAKEAVADDPQATVWSRKEVAEASQATMIADVMVKEIKERYASENPTLLVYLSGVGNYRYGIATRASYKGNRAGSPQPTHLRAVREHLIARGAVVSAGEEADDLIGIAATENYPDCVVCSIDKDLMQLPGRHYNFVTKEEAKVSSKEACLNLYAQVIAGDATDNVPGCKGYGDIKARKALEDCKSAYACWTRSLEVYYDTYGDDGLKFATETARLVYVRRREGDVFTPPASNGMSNGDTSETTKTEAHSNKKAGSSGRVSKRTGAGDSGATNSAGGAV